MEIAITDKKLLRANRSGKFVEAYGVQMAKKIQLRLATLGAAESLVAFWPPKSGSERCHELIGDLAGTFSIDLAQPYRLLFKPIEDLPPADRTDEKKRWETIKSIEIVGIEDTHG